MPSSANTRSQFAFTRRQVVAGLSAAPLLPSLPRRSVAAPLKELALFGPPATPSVTLAHAIAGKILSPIAEAATFRAWRTPDEMRAGLTSGTMPLVIMPTTVAANLHNRGFGLRLVNVMTNGLLYVIAADPALTSFPALKGKRLAVPFRNDTPEFVASRLLRHHGLTAGKDVQVDTTGTPIEAIQMVLAGRLDAALVPEPAVSAAILRGALVGKTIHPVMDIQTEWASAFGGPPVLPQAGLAVTQAFLDRNADTVRALQSLLGDAAASVIADPSRAAADSAAALELPAPVIARAIPRSRLVATAARTARDDLARYYQIVADTDPSVIGGKLPGEAFYL